MLLSLSAALAHPFCSPVPVEQCDPPDRDCDGLLDEAEAAHRSDPDHPDSDRDGLLDGFEVRHGLDPIDADTNHDGISDCEALAAAVSPVDDFGPVVSLTDGTLQGSYAWSYRVDLSRYPSPNQRDEQHSELLLGMAVSGGGMRAANFGQGVMMAFDALNLLSEVDYFSTVSGGGYAPGMYVSQLATENDLPLEAELERLRAPVSTRGRVVLRTIQGTFSKGRQPRLRPAYTTSDHTGRALDCNFMPNAQKKKLPDRRCGRWTKLHEPLRLEDLFEMDSDQMATLPMWVTNSTTLPDGQVFPLSPDIVERLGATQVLVPYNKLRTPLEAPSDVPVLTGMMASSAVPGAFPPVQIGLPKHPGEEDVYLQLVDGGFSDRFGAATLLDMMLRESQHPDSRGADRKVAVIVDTRPAFEAWNDAYRHGKKNKIWDIKKQIGWSYEALRYSQNYLFYDKIFGYSGNRSEGDDALPASYLQQPSLAMPPATLLFQWEGLDTATLSCARGATTRAEAHESCWQGQTQSNAVTTRIQEEGQLEPEKVYLWRSQSRKWFSTTICEDPTTCSGPDDWDEARISEEIHNFRLGADLLVNPAAEWDPEVLSALGKNRNRCLNAAAERFVTTVIQPTDLSLDPPTPTHEGVWGHTAKKDVETRQQRILEAGQLSVWAIQVSLQTATQAGDLVVLEAPIEACRFEHTPSCGPDTPRWCAR